MLNPSERTKLIIEISSRLALSADRSVIDLTLQQFSLPYWQWRENWNGTLLSYAIEMVSEAQDDVLISLARHLSYEHDNVRLKVQPDFWLPNHFQLFISHLATYKEDATILQTELQNFQISSFVAHNDIEPTAEWQKEIEAALSTSDAMVVLLRKGFHESNWTDQEIGYAMGRGILIVPIRFEEDPYGFISRFQALSGTNKQLKSLAEEIFDILKKHDRTNRRIAEALISKMEQSASYADAKKNIALLEDITYWNTSFNSRLENAIESNSQIKNSWNVPDRMKSLIRNKTSL